MKNSDENLFSHPEVVKYLTDIFPIITSESDRGSVLIAASQVDLFLKKVLEEVAPKKMSSSKLKSLFEFTGPLGTANA